jgi:hypothetical protein
LYSLYKYFSCNGYIRRVIAAEERKLERVERRRTGRSASAFKKNTKHTLTVTVGEGVVNRMHLAAVLEALRVGEQMRRVLVLMSRYAACWRVDTCSACIH